MPSEHRYLRLVIPFLCLLPVFVVSLPTFPRSDASCVSGPTNWVTVALFYLLNYVTHVSTIKSYPGDTWQKSMSRAVLALILPFSGIWSACIAIARSKMWNEPHLRHALRAQALCAVVRTDEWRPRPGEKIPGCHTLGISSASGEELLKGTLEITSSPLEGLYITKTTDHIPGQAVFDDEYALQVLPSSVSVSRLNRVDDAQPGDDHDLELCNSYNVLKWIASVLQLCFALFTLVQTRGNQISQYGYAAFGLTVIPYAIMSIVNFIANAVTPDYPYIYLVQSEVMDEAKPRGAKFDGAVGRLKWTTKNRVKAKSYKSKQSRLRRHL
jgi:hypothetical protein